MKVAILLASLAGAAASGASEPAADSEPAALKRLLSAAVSSKTCAELGWSTDGDDFAVCRGSEFGSGCSGSVNWAAAVAFCEGGGARLCTLGDMQLSETSETGCVDGSTLQWTSDACADGYILTIEGAAFSACSGAESSFPTSCCADVGTVAPLMETGTMTHITSDSLLTSSVNTTMLTAKSAALTIVEATAISVESVDLGDGEVINASAWAKLQALCDDAQTNLAAPVTRVQATLAQGESIVVTHANDTLGTRLVSIIAPVNYVTPTYETNPLTVLYSDFEDMGRNLAASGESELPSFSDPSNVYLSTSHPRFGSKALYSYDYPHMASYSLGAGTLDFGTGDFTIRFWFFTEQGYLTGGFWGNVLSTINACGPSGSNWAVGMNSLCGLRVFRSDVLETACFGALDSSGGRYAASTWYHIAVERFSGTTRLFLDGVLAHSFSDPYSYFTASSTLYVGGTCDWDNTPRIHIDELEVTKMALYEGVAFDPPTAPDPSMEIVSISTTDDESAVGPVYDSSRYVTTFVNSSATRVKKASSGTEDVVVVVRL